MSKVLVLPFLFVFLLPLSLRAQCSDAGVCAIGNTQDGESEQKRGHRIALRYVYGISGGPDDLHYHSVLFEGTAALLPGGRIIALLPYVSIDGPLGYTHGVGDVTLLWDQWLWRGDDMVLHARLGGKLATGNDNANNLPQAYQPGLGTNDILFGVHLDANSWSVTLAYQSSAGRSDNALTRLKRGDDLLLRAGYHPRLGVLGFNFEVIAIQRMTESSVRDLSTTDNDAFINVPNSDQLQINLLAAASAPLSSDFRLAAFAALPVLQRDVNVDGLKRALTLSLGIEWSM